MTHGCMMSQSLYVKANGEIPCWDDIGETLTLRTLSETALRGDSEGAIFNGPEMHYIRGSFLAGRIPYPGLCEHCGVLGHGITETSLHLRTMQVLHLEASYLCHLSCNSCIPAEERRSLKSPPYNMSPAFLDGLLRALRSEGVRQIRFIHFEGRGDALVNRRLPDLIRLCRDYFPQAFVCITTHCSYPYMPWVVQHGPDLLRASIDGATPESYAMYRQGGKFELAIDFLRKLRDDRIRTGSRLRVEWKYILFQWNDGEAEMKGAAELAKELQAQLTFVRTHSPGHSWRFRTDEELRDYLLRELPGCGMEQTFQLKPAVSLERTGIAEHVALLLSKAIDDIRAGRFPAAAARTAEALKYDPEVLVPVTQNIDEMLHRALPRILLGTRFPSTLSWLAAVSREFRDTATSDALLTRYLEMAPNAPDRNQVLGDRLVRSAVEHAEKSEFDAACSYLREAVALEYEVSGEPIEQPIEFCVQKSREGACRAGLAAGAASIALAMNQLSAAHALFCAYLESEPQAVDRGKVEGIIRELERSGLPSPIGRILNRIHALTNALIK